MQQRNQILKTPNKYLFADGITVYLKYNRFHQLAQIKRFIWQPASYKINKHQQLFSKLPINNEREVEKDPI